MKCKQVFVVGPVKAGITSLREALRVMGYTPTEHDITHLRWGETGNFSRLVEAAKSFDCCLDMPWAYMPFTLREAFPDAYYILTWRDARRIAISEWYWKQASPHNDWAGGPPPEEWIRARTIDINTFRNAIISDFNTHNIKYIQWDVDTGGWIDLCVFLGEEVPTIDFPHLNRSAASDIRFD